MLHLCRGRIMPVGVVALVSLIWIPICLGQGQPRPLPIKGEFAAPQWSPDGQWLGLTTPKYQGIYIVKPDGSGLKQISDEIGAGYRFAWSPDARRIAFKARNVNGQAGKGAVRIAAIDGSGSKTVIESDGDVGLPVWTDNQSIRFTADRKVTVARLAEGKLERQAASNAHAVAQAADGKTVIADAAEDDRIVMIDENGDKKFLTESKDGRFYDVRVSPKGNCVLAHNLADGHIYVIDLAGGARKDVGEGYAGQWSPDGKRIVCNTSQDDGHQVTAADIVVIDVAGGGRKAVTATPDRFEMYPCWAPDGKKIAYADARSKTIFVQTVEGGAN